VKPKKANRFSTFASPFFFRLNWVLFRRHSLQKITIWLLLCPMIEDIGLSLWNYIAYVVFLQGNIGPPPPILLIFGFLKSYLGGENYPEKSLPKTVF